MEKVNWKLYIAALPLALIVILAFGYVLNTIAEMGGG